MQKGILLAAPLALALTAIFVPAQGAQAEESDIQPEACVASPNGHAKSEPVPRTVTAEGRTYDLVWNDEFCGGGVDWNKKWNKHGEPENGPFSYPSVEGPKTDPNSNLFVEDGALNIRAHPASGLNSRKIPIVAASGSISTRDHAAWKYGRFEVRLRTPGEHGTWPAFWLMPKQNPYGWPKDGELDWFENLGDAWARKINFTSIHASTVPWNPRRSENDHATDADSKSIGPVDLPGSYHTWTMDWSPSGFVFYVDGKEYSRRSAWQNQWIRPDGSHYQGAMPEPFDKKFYVIANLAMGGWAARPDKRTDWSKTFQIDHFRVYQTKEQQQGQNLAYVKYQTGGYGEQPAALKDQPVGTRITNLPNLSDPRAHFEGWYLDANFTKPVNEGFTLEDDTVLFAKWNPRHPKVATAPAPSSNPFKDVTTGSPFAAEIAWMKDSKTSTGWPDHTFRPYNKINRDAMAAFMYRMAGSPAYNAPAKATFKDVPKANIFYKEISWMKDSGITTGWADGTFRPFQPVERGAMAAFLYRFCDKYPTKCSPDVATKIYQPVYKDLFKDVRYKHNNDLRVAPFHHEIGWLKDAGITTGWPDGNFRPVDSIDRNAMAAFIYRAKNNKR
ncbi:hypothetical protein HMPREF2835_09975 [Actinomyces sp. HMSC072A03]|nr:hypothetical protein HMPREF2835_09975 [Actinomyces sp. HMSC072A03]